MRYSASGPILLFALVVLAASLALTDVWDAGAGGDVALYARYGESIVGGAVPYRDLAIEYPPGSLAVIVPPAVFASNPLSFGDIFVGISAALFAAMIVASWFILVALGHRNAGLLARMLPLALAPILLGPVAVQRLDPLPALIVSVALLAAVFDRIVVAAFLAGIGTATKLYPAVLMPALLTRAHRLGGRRAALVAALFFGAGVILVVLPFVLVGGTNGLIDMLRYHVDRPLQIETLGSSVALLLHVVAGFDVGLATGYGSVNLGGARGHTIGIAQELLLIAVLGWVLVRTVRIASSRSGLILATATVVTAVVGLGKVLSPQYLVWLLPLIPLVSGRTGAFATVTLAIACVLTRIWYEHLYEPVTLGGGLDPGGIVLLAVRNAALVLLLGALLLEMEREARRSDAAL